ncbi:SusC/RagA family TonB-linked outer membrane protein, partial [Parabacteroides distasonis]
EGKLRVTAKAGISLEVPDLSSYHLLNASDKLELEKMVGLYTSVTNPGTQVNLDKYYNERLKTIQEGTDIDWMSKPLRNGVGQRYNIQLDGGANEFRWGASLGYNGIEGAMKGSSRRTITGDITLMYSVKNVIFRNYTSVASNKSKESKYGSFQNYVDM